ncbi:MAG: DUF4303 domain-containing protein, partial [Micrococcaceae bacterium]|nr:DUF4303 domain-containing protein [Micrococcaceae bacterium]
MGVDWTALEEAIRVSALRQAEEIIDRHPDEVFYAIALDGVSADETDHIDLPVLALNSEEALTRSFAEDNEEGVSDDENENEDFEERADADDDGSDRDTHRDDNDDSDSDDDDNDEVPSDEEDDEDDIDAVLKEFDALTSDVEQGYYSSKWNPADWQWSPIELFDESATNLWSQALTGVAKSH